MILVIVLGIGMSLGLVAGPSDWWLTWLPAGIMIAVAVAVIWAARWGHKLAARTKRRWLRTGIHVDAVIAVPGARAGADVRCDRCESSCGAR